jgi:predicted RNase H-like nuclease
MDTYLGIDLAWSDRNDSGMAALRGASETLEVVDLGLARGLDAVLAWIDGQLESAHAAGGRVIIMVDAPLIVRNETGRRPGEDALQRRFGAHHAAPYPANRRLLGAYRGDGRLAGEVLGEALARRGFEWPPRPLRRTLAARARIVQECYPHPAHVQLFALMRTLAYKKKQGRSWDDVRGAFARYVSAMRQLRSPQLQWTPEIAERFAVSTLKGVAYKRAEDQLDALCCAYIAALLPREGRLEAFGEPETGMIVVPAGPARA